MRLAWKPRAVTPGVGLNYLVFWFFSNFSTIAFT